MNMINFEKIYAFFLFSLFIVSVFSIGYTLGKIKVMKIVIKKLNDLEKKKL